MPGKCAKCKDSLLGGGVFIESGESFSFCRTCSDLLAKAPTGNTIRDFLGHRKYERCVTKNMKQAKEIRETRVERDMRKARERRARGESPWPNAGLIADEKT